MKKIEFIEKYGEEAYENKLVQRRMWRERNRKCYEDLLHNLSTDKCEICSEEFDKNQKLFKQHQKDLLKQLLKERRLDGYTPYCPQRYKEIENYELAKADNFDKKKWECHHRMEEYFSQRTLQAYGMYYDIDPSDLIWLPVSEHRSDSATSVWDPSKAKYHQRKLELWGKNLEDYKQRNQIKARATWKENEKYINCEGKHQLYDHEQFKQYHLDYQRKFREENPEYYNNYWKKKRLPGRIKKLEDKLNNPEWLSKRRKVDIDGSMIKLNELKELYKEQYGEEYHG